MKTARDKILDRIKYALKSEDTTRGSQLGSEQDSFASNDLRQLVYKIITNCKHQRADLIKQFEAELKKVGEVFRAVANAEAVYAHLEKLALYQKAKTAVGWEAPIISDAGLFKALEKAGVELTLNDEKRSPAEFVKKTTEADIGISCVDYALAYTGTLILLTGKGKARSVSLLPPIHVAIVRPEQILRGLDDLFPLLEYHGSVDTASCSAVTFITSPSRTADIEMTLVVGVHGPQQLHVILLEQDSGSRDLL